MIIWTEPSDEDFDHVLITWNPSGTEGTSVNAGTVTCDITGLINGTEYAITVQSVDTSGNASTGETAKITPPVSSVPVHYIYTEEELDAIDDNTDNLDDYYFLMSDLDLSVFSNWTSIGDNTNPFTGTFDGNGHVIKNLTINLALAYPYQGLFGYTSGILIKNLGLENVSINCTGDNIGSLIGFAAGCIIEKCYATGSVSGRDYVGGLSGYPSNGTVSNSYSTCTISGDQRIGGLIGMAATLNIKRCYATGDVTGTVQRIGGLVGDMNSNSSGYIVTESRAEGVVTGPLRVGGLFGALGCAKLTYCYATGNVICSGDYSGGLVGYAGGTYDTEIYYCYASGTVSGVNYVGGFAGYNYRIISNCYATGNVTGTDIVGGFTGCHAKIAAFSVDLSYCYSAGTVSGGTNYGGLAGQISGTGIDPTNCFYDSATSGYDADGGVGWTVAGAATSTTDMKTQSTFTGAGWDLSTIWSIFASINNDYPYLTELEP